MNGKLAVKFFAGGLLDFCKRYIANYDADRFEIVALRVFAAKGFTVTIYARDKYNTSTTLPDNKEAIKKFKLENVNAAEIPLIVEAFNFTLSLEDYHLDEMEVMNK